MSDKPIQAGDLVRVVKSHCATQSLSEYGIHRIVLDVRTATEPDEYARCHGCGCAFNWPSGGIAEMGPDGWHPIAWLQKIDPPALDIDTTTRDELHA